MVSILTSLWVIQLNALTVNKITSMLMKKLVTVYYAVKKKGPKNRERTFKK